MKMSRNTQNVFEEEKFTSKKKIKADMLSERLQGIIEPFSIKISKTSIAN